MKPGRVGQVPADDGLVDQQCAHCLRIVRDRVGARCRAPCPGLFSPAMRVLNPQQRAAIERKRNESEDRVLPSLPMPRGT